MDPGVFRLPESFLAILAALWRSGLGGAPNAQRRGERQTEIRSRLFRNQYVTRICWNNSGQDIGCIFRTRVEGFEKIDIHRRHPRMPRGVYVCVLLTNPNISIGQTGDTYWIQHRYANCFTIQSLPCFPNYLSAQPRIILSSLVISFPKALPRLGR